MALTRRALKAMGIDEEKIDEIIAMHTEANLNISLEIYNTESVKRLQEENPDILPVYTVDESKDLAYNKKQINNAIMSAIIQGKSIDGIADELGKRMESLNRNSAIKAARTGITNAQNAGTLSSMKELAAMGVEVQKEWVATLDSRTRPSHQALDGQRRELDEAFSNGLQYPGDSSGSAVEVWNCRCTIVPYLPEYDLEDEPRLTYSEWVAYKKATGSTAKKITKFEYERAKLRVTSKGTMREIHSRVSIPEAYNGDFSDYQELNLKPEEEKAFRTLNEKAKAHESEYAMIIHRGKATRAVTDNQYDRVSISGLRKEINDTGLKIYHSHTNETSLSSMDLYHLCDDAVDEVGCISINGDVYIVRIGNGWRPTKEEFRDAVNNIKSDVDLEMMYRALEEGWSPEEATYMAIKEQTYRIAREFGWEYEGGRLGE